MALGSNLVEVILKKNEIDESIAKVVDLTEGVGSKKGENYLSQIQRFEVKVLLTSGRQRTVHLIIKNVLSTHYSRELAASEGFFVREITMYRDVLPAMENTLEEMSDAEDRLWPKCFASRPYDQLIFEDLGAAGYVLLKRKEQLNLQRSLLIMGKLAKFHALSKILLDNMQIPLEVFQKHVMLKDDVYAISASKGLSDVLEVMDNWGEEWKDLAVRLKEALPNIGSRIIDVLKGEPTDWTVLNHGDCWTNNILFKNEMDSEYSIDAKFIDMQMCFIGSPVIDLHHFMVTSVQPEEFAINSQLLLQKYSHSLKTYLLKFGYSGPIPTLAQINEQLTKSMVLRLAIASVFIPIALGDENEMPNFEEFAVKEAEAKKQGLEPPAKMNAFLNSSEQIKRKLKQVLREAVEQNVI